MGSIKKFLQGSRQKARPLFWLLSFAAGQLRVAVQVRELARKPPTVQGPGRRARIRLLGQQSAFCPRV